MCAVTVKSAGFDAKKINMNFADQPEYDPDERQ
jgi:hypothetical protein